LALKTKLLHQLEMTECLGTPLEWFQPWWVSPDLAFATSFSALCAGVLSDRRRMWPKMEWRRAAMVSTARTHVDVVYIISLMARLSRFWRNANPKYDTIRYDTIR